MSSSSSNPPTERTPLLDARPQEGAESPPQNGQTANVVLPMRIFIPTMLAIFASLILAAIDGVLVLTLVAPISSSFGASEKAAWIGVSYLIVVTAFTATYGKLADILGRKWTMLIALTFFAIGNGVCAIAPSLNWLLAGRAISGVGGAGLQTTASIITSDIVSLQYRGLLQGITNIVWSMGTASGGPLGGLIHEAFGWRAAFGFQLPPLALAAVAVWLFVDIPLPETAQNQSLKAKLQRLDVMGTIMLVSAVLSSQLSLTFFAVKELPLADVRVWGLALASIISTILFLFVEATTPEPLLPLRMLRNPSTASTIVYFFLSSLCFLAINFQIPIFFQTVLFLTPGQSGLRFTPMSASVSIGSVFAGLYIKRLHRYKGLWIFSVLCTIVSTSYMTTWNRLETPKIMYWLSGIPLAFGGASAATIALIALLGSVKKEEFAIVNGLMYLSRSLGSVMGVGIGGALAQRVLTAGLQKQLSDQKLIERIRHDAASIVHLPQETRDIARDCYQSGVKTVFLYGAIGFALCLPLVLVTKEGKFDKEEERPKPVDDPSRLAEED